MNTNLRGTIFLAVSLLALSQHTAAQESPSNSKELDSFVRSQESKKPSISACGALQLADTIEAAFSEEAKAVWRLRSLLGADEDKLWDDLIDCANTTKGDSQRSDALRLAAMWERLRAEEFKNRYQREKSAEREQMLAAPKPPASGKTTVVPSEPVPNVEVQVSQPPAMSSGRNSQQWIETSLAKPEPIAVAGEAKLSAPDFARVVVHNRGVCDQVITIAALTPSGLALYIPPEGQKFMAKNATNYPRMCLLQETDSSIVGVPRYLLVWAYYDGAYQGFQPVQQMNIAPVFGSGTVIDGGKQWNFTFHGSITDIETVEAPYVIQSRTLYLNAYDGRGVLVSRRSITHSSQSGGDAAYSAGYNAAGLVSLLWSNPSRLIKSVLADVQKVSGH